MKTITLKVSNDDQIEIFGSQGPWQFSKPDHLPLLYKQTLEWSKTQPLKGVTILNNTPLSYESFCKIGALIQAGAKVTVTATKTLHPKVEPLIIKQLEVLGIEFVSNHDQLKGRDFDYILDCSAEFAHGIVKVNRGIVELTQSGTLIYQKSSSQVPIICVDDSRLKALETTLGTGQGFVNALETFCPKGSLDNIETVIMGYGRVGRGVEAALRRFTNRITIIDICKSSLETARSRHITAIHVDDDVHRDQAVQEAKLIITATGKSGVISKYYKPSDLVGKFLSNVGVEDEFGDLFPENIMLGQTKFSLNFLIEYPTPVKFIDPILYAHNYAAVLMHQDSSFAPGYHALPLKKDRQLFDDWKHIHADETVLFEDLLPGPITQI